jgi:poly-gamma-glutamate synthesis protein (capsule biosynthesis protein)
MPEPETRPIRIFLCGDVMTGRGVDQILPEPSSPELYERWMTSAADYVALAERRCGAIPRPAGFDAVWGDALDLWRRQAPDVRIANLETSITRSDAPWPKGINYRMSPEHTGVLTAAGFDACALANNHVLDWERPGLIDTLEALHRAGIATAGAGRDLAEARAPAVIEAPGKGRVLVFSVATESSGVPEDWAAGQDRAGVNFIDLSSRSAESLIAEIARVRRAGDVVVVSIHWGGNWGYQIPEAHKAFAHALVRDGGASIVHGHSSHHPLGVEVFEGGLVLYGCGDFLNDYEGIGGYEAYRSDLVLGFIAGVDPAGGALVALEAFPLRIARFRLNRVTDEEAQASLERLNRESAAFGVQAERQGGRFVLRWAI